MKHTKFFAKNLTVLLMTVLLLFTSVVNANSQSVEIDGSEKVVYLTFDDGPSPTWTREVLELLDFYNAKATFYMVGANAASNYDLVREVAKHGQTIGVHTFNHVDLSWASYATFYSEVDDTASVIVQALADGDDLRSQFVRCIRPPYGGVSDLMYENAYSMGYAVSMWHIDTNDWRGESPEAILENFRILLAPKKVVLMHDGGLNRENTIQALHLILHEILMQGYQAKPQCK